MGPLMINMAFMLLYMWEMWDVTPVTHEHTDEQWKVVQYSVWAESAIHVEIVEGSVCADVLTGIGVGGGMKIDSDIPTFVLWFVWIFSPLWHLTLDLDLECHLDIIDPFLM